MRGLVLNVIEAAGRLLPGRRGPQRILRWGGTLGFALLVLGPVASAQIPDTAERSPASEHFYSSRYLSLGNWSYAYIDLLIARGVFNDLAPLMQPYRRVDVAREILEAEKDGSLDTEERKWLALLRREFDGELELLEAEKTQELSFSGEFIGGFEAVSQLHRDQLRPTGSPAFFPTASLRLFGEAPHVAGALDFRWSNHYLNDPQFPGGRAVPRRQCDPIVAECAYRMEEAYVELQWQYVRLFFGRMYRNWGLPGTDGFLISPYQYSYDQLGYRFGSERVALQGMFTSFNDFGTDTTHYLSTHRFDWRVRDNLVIAVGESAVFGGPGRNVDFILLNPVGAWEVNGARAANLLGMAELWWRPYRKLVTRGVFMVDNTSVGDSAKTNGIVQYAAGLNVQAPAVMPTLGLRLDFSLVSSLAYRSRVAFWEYYSQGQPGYQIGLAHDKTDAIVISGQGDWFVRPDVLLRPYLQVMWKGEDNITSPWPDDAFTGHDLLLVGTVETTIRPALGGQWRYPLGKLTWDIGLNFINNYHHVPRDSRVEAVGRIAGDLRIRF